MSRRLRMSRENEFEETNEELQLPDVSSLSQFEEVEDYVVPEVPTFEEPVEEVVFQDKDYLADARRLYHSHQGSELVIPQIFANKNLTTYEKVFLALETFEYISEAQINDPHYFHYKERGKRKSVFMKLTEEDLNNFVADVHGSPDYEFLVEKQVRLNDNTTARVHIPVPPVVDYPTVTIARKLTHLKTLSDLKEKGMFNLDVMQFLEYCIEAKLTMVIVGGTGAGKSTLLEAITRQMPENERIGLAEDAPELSLDQINVAKVRSTVRIPGMQDYEVATLQWAVQQMNRMRVDRIIVGETRGKEFYDFLVAANSGYDGSLTTIHANSPVLALQKMTNFVNQATGQSERSINQTISNTIDVIVQIGVTDNGEHRVKAISSVLRNLNQDETASISTEPIYEYNEKSDDWKFKMINQHIRNKFNASGIKFEAKSNIEIRTREF